MKKINQKSYKYNKGFSRMISSLEDTSFGLCSAPLSYKDAIEILSSYLLGDDFSIAMPVSPEQANSIIVENILDKYSKKWRSDYSRYETARQFINELNIEVK